MSRKPLLIVGTILSIVFMGGIVAVNDAHYRQEGSYRDLQIQVASVYGQWNMYLGTLRGLLLSSGSFGDILAGAEHGHQKVLAALFTLDKHAGMLPRQVAEPLAAFTRSIQEGLRLGGDIQHAGALFLAQDDLPAVFREGRAGLYSLVGKDATRELGPHAAFQYYQLAGKLKSMNVLFDQLFTDRLNSFQGFLAGELASLSAAFFLYRMVFLILAAVVISLTLVQLYRVNKVLGHIADTATKELSSTRDHLSEVQGFLHHAQFQQSLFTMVAGMSHQLNTPLGNCISTASFLEQHVRQVQDELAKGVLTRDALARGLDTGMQGFRLLDDNLNTIKLHVDTFKRLSSVNQDTNSGSTELGIVLDQELRRISGAYDPTIATHVDIGNAADVMMELVDLDCIVEQLVSNSHLHGGARNIHVSCRKEDHVLVIDYRDDGTGVPPDTMAKLGDPFFTGARGRGHMGLGISIMASLVRFKYQGSIVHTTAGSGGLCTRLMLIPPSGKDRRGAHSPRPD